ncbi:MAG TPA: guanylate kinase [Caldithrix abyssi]|uniref:Guanylate kinase n=1 Tax=Caldithrix abyssi TaxID=187145 RepID=A0A7V4U3L3_CALAY|nr:guanylate kinase [Caldithrix abyssi]
MKFISPYIAFSAPSGAGKTTIAKTLQEKYKNELVISVSATTRPRRPEERDGVDYFFLKQEEFEKAIAQNRFLEYEQVHDWYYGTLKDTVEEAVKKGKTVLFDIDVNGALSIKKHYPQAVLIFIQPPSEEALIERLKNRKSESEETIRKRLKRMEYEYSMVKHFDHIVVNDDLQRAVREIEHIITAK